MRCTVTNVCLLESLIGPEDMNVRQSLGRERVKPTGKSHISGAAEHVLLLLPFRLPASRRPPLEPRRAAS